MKVIKKLTVNNQYCKYDLVPYTLGSSNYNCLANYCTMSSSFIWL